MNIIIPNNAPIGDRIPLQIESGGALTTAQVTIAIGPGAETLRGDSAKLHDALRNLVANAISYAPEQTTIRVEASRADGRVAVSVSD